jgi:hypothetical protein
MKKVTIIFSGEYVNASLQSEFGRILPSMLPVGNRMLIEQQVSREDFGYVILTVPEDLSIKQREFIKQRVPGIIFFDTLPQQNLLSSMSALFFSDFLKGFDTVSLFLGDTLIDDFHPIENSYSSHKPSTNYDWTGQNKQNGHVFSGYIYEAKKQKIQAALTRCRQNNTDMFSAAFFDDFTANETGLWYDFGHYQNYHLSKRSFLSARHFNSIAVTPYSVKKSSENKKKLVAEANWYNSCPHDILYHCPQLYSWSDSEYEIEYFYANTLAELSLFSELPVWHWNKIIMSALDVLEKFKGPKFKDLSSEKLKNFVLIKTTERMKLKSSYPFDPDRNFLMDTGFSVSLNEILEYCYEFWPPNIKTSEGFCHGDFCFSNILFDARSNQIKLIDPRGLNESGEIDTNGFIAYDVAKFTHSYVYLYDKVISGRFSTSFNGGQLSSNYARLPNSECAIFWREIKARFCLSETEVKFLVLNLFLSMIPLHLDDQERQLTFIYIAASIYHELLNNGNTG